MSAVGTGVEDGPEVADAQLLDDRCDGGEHASGLGWIAPEFGDVGDVLLRDDQ